MKQLRVFENVPIPVDYASTQTYALLAKREGGKSSSTSTSGRTCGWCAAGASASIRSTSCTARSTRSPNTRSNFRALPPDIC